VRYLLNQWEALDRYCDDGDLSIDNNATERSLRGIAIGRNNWTFLGSDSGGHTASVLRSFTGSCQLIGVEPFAWFRDVLARINAPPSTASTNSSHTLGRRSSLKPCRSHVGHALRPSPGVSQPLTPCPA